MKVKIKGKTTVFDVKIVSKLDYDEFEKLCNEQSTFKQLPEKKRIAKIKEVYDSIRATIKSKETGHTKDISGNTERSAAGDIGAKQRSTSTGAKHQKSEDKAKISESKVRKEKGKDES